MNKPLISVITPTYNHEKYIGQCIESVLQQTYPNWELVIIDDGSIDKTQDIINKYRDNRIIYLKQDNKGIWNLAENYNKALRASNGEWIAILEGDDLWPCDRLEKQVKLLVNTGDENFNLIYGRAKIINDNGNVTGEIRGTPRNTEILLNRPVGKALKRLLVSNYIRAVTVLIKRKALEEIGGFIQPVGFPAVDFSTWVHLAVRGEFRFIDDILGYWRIHASQSSANMRIEQAKGHAIYAQRFFDNIDKRFQYISGWNRDDLIKNLELTVGRAYFQAGRFRLLQDDQLTAKSLFLQAFKKGDAIIKLKALFGLSCAISGIDMEKLVKLIGLTPLR